MPLSIKLGAREPAIMPYSKCRITIKRVIKLNRFVVAWIALSLCCVLTAGSRTSAPSPTAESRGECLSVPSRILGRSVPYCVILPPGYSEDANRRYPVLYYFHGLGDNQQMFVRSGGFNLVEELWDRQ